MTSGLLLGSPLQAQSGDQLISKVVTAGITALFRKCEQIDAQIRAEPIAKLLQGSIDGFELIGKGLLMYNGLRIEGMELYSQAISIDFSQIFQGRVKLRRSTQSTMRVVLTEADLATSFNTPFILSKLKLLTIDDQPLEFRQVSVAISNDARLRIMTQVKVGSEGEWVDLDFSVKVEVLERRKIQFVEPVIEGNEPSIRLSQFLIDHVNDLLDLDKFALDGTQLRVDRVRLWDHKIVFYGTAQIDRFPTRQGF